ncbi:MAG: EAL domain-containing protein [Hyphomicrobium sp.]|jgi:diguanylate cyclase (GGDEF)-like protein/PAS domain S-box-containing protein
MPVNRIASFSAKDNRRARTRTRRLFAGSKRVSGSAEKADPLTREALQRALLAEVAAQNEMRAAHARLREAIDMLPEGIVFLDDEGRYVLWNKRYEEIYRTSADLFEVGRHFMDTLRIGVSRGDYPEATGREEAWLNERFAKLNQPQARHEQWLTDGRCILIEERRLSAGGTVGLRVDITDLKEREASFRLLFDANPVPMFVLARDTKAILSANEAALTHYGYVLGDLLKKTLFDMHHERDHAALDELCSCRGRGDTGRIWKHLKHDGSEIDVAIYSRPLEHERTPALLFSAVDITERMRAEERVLFMSRHDTLTGLPNRAAIIEEIEMMLARMRRGAGDTAGGATLRVGLDYFKSVNETLGHVAGDMLLKKVARRMADLLRSGEFIARLGSDEFGVLVRDADDPREISAVAHRLRAAISAPYVINGVETRISASIGIAFAPRDGNTADLLLKSADLALTQAKESGRGAFRFYEPEMHRRSDARRRLESDLRTAIARHELEVHYQPLITLETGEVTGAEALVRWHHPERGYISPVEFIPVAEALGLIEQLGAQVLLKACAAAVNWPSMVTVAVNFSPLQFRRSNVFEMVANTLRSTGLPPGRLEVEITESVFMENSEQVIQVLQQLRSLGVRIAMDDFGTGYSSLGYLCRFPFDKIKIDRSFVRDLGNQRDQQAVVLAVMGLGRALGKTIVAEGIETQEDLHCLKAAGCHQGQGYLFSRPCPEPELLELIHALSSRSAA